MKTASEFYRNAHGKKVVRIVEGMATIDTWEADKERIKARWIEQGASPEEIKEQKDGSITCRSSYARTPVMMKEEVGTFTVRSADYIFTPDRTLTNVYGDKKGSKVVNGELVKEIPNLGTYRYRIVD